MMLEWTGERYVPWMEEGEIHYEHLHRYRFAKEFVKGKKALDLACGEGYGSFMLAEDAREVIGVDIDEVTIRHASSRYIKDNLTFLKGSVTDIPIKGEKIFDAIVCFEAIEHIDEHDEMMREVKRLLKKDGIFIVSTPNKYIYSDQANYQNPFHLKELYFDDFKRLMSDNFQNVYVYGQKIYPSSNIFPLHGESGPSNDFVIEKGEKEFLFLPPGKKSARYFIAVASDSRLDKSLVLGNSYLLDLSETLFVRKDVQISHLGGVVKEKEAEIENFRRTISQRDSRVLELTSAVSEKDSHIGSLEAAVRKLDGQIGDLKETINRGAMQITRLEGMVRTRENEAERLKAGLADREREILGFKDTLTQRDASIVHLESAVSQKDANIVHLESAVSQREASIVHLKSVVSQKDANIVHLKSAVSEKDANIVYLESVVNQKEASLNHIYLSHGWRALLAYYRLRDRILPASSGRRKAAKSVWSFLKKSKSSTSRLSGKGNVRKSILYIKHYGVVMFAKKAWSKLTSEEGKPSHKPNVPNLSLPVIKEAEGEITPYEDATVSVVIPTKNAGSYFKLLLSMLKRQKGIKDMEIIVVDSGSSDKTVETARAYGARVVEIPPEKFSHSYSRNVGVENSSGQYLFFTVQDALPPSELFLYEVFTVLKNNDVAAVSCAEFPREDVDLFYNVLLWNHYKFLEVDKEDRILSLPETGTHMNLRKNGQLSNLNCLIPKHVFMKYKFRCDYAEDLDLGIRLIKDGYKLAFLSSIKIIHSHNRPPYYFLRRGYVDALFLTSIFPDYPLPTIKEERLLRDILLTYHSLASFINKDLSQIKTPINVDQLFEIVRKTLSSSSFHEYACFSNDVDCQQTDEDFRSFLKEVSEICHVPEGNNSHDGILNHALLNFMDVAWEHMSSSYQMVDDDVLEDFKSLMTKAFALQCGAYLGYCYLNGGCAVKGLHGRLKREI